MPHRAWRQAGAGSVPPCVRVAAHAGSSAALLADQMRLRARGAGSHGPAARDHGGRGGARRPFDVEARDLPWRRAREPYAACSARSCSSRRASTRWCPTSSASSSASTCAPWPRRDRRRSTRRSGARPLRRAASSAPRPRGYGAARRRVPRRSRFMAKLDRRLHRGGHREHRPRQARAARRRQRRSACRCSPSRASPIPPASPPPCAGQGRRPPLLGERLRRFNEALRGSSIHQARRAILLRTPAPSPASAWAWAAGASARSRHESKRAVPTVEAVAVVLADGSGLRPLRLAQEGGLFGGLERPWWKGAPPLAAARPPAAPASARPRPPARGRGM